MVCHEDVRTRHFLKDRNPESPGDEMSPATGRSPGRREAPDESIVERAARVAQGTGPSSAGTRRMAFLVFDSHDDIALVGSRSAVFRPRRMLFQSGPAALDLELRTDRRGAHASLLGQLRGTPITDGSRIRLEGHVGTLEAPIDEKGWFELEIVRVGTYAATVFLGATSLEIPSLVV
jgi:hypothetical protein